MPLLTRGGDNFKIEDDVDVKNGKCIVATYLDPLTDYYFGIIEY
jgi:hypothetical protein